LHLACHLFYFLLICLLPRQRGSLDHCSTRLLFSFHYRSLPPSSWMGVGFAGVKGALAQAKGASKWGIHTLLLNHGVRGLQGIYFFVNAQIANAGCMCSVIVYFLHCICVCDCDSRHESLIMLSHSVMVRRSHLLTRCYLGTMCMCTTNWRAL
jgi:hypothetical protein